MSPVPPKPPRASTDVPRERSGPTHHNRFARPATASQPSPRPGSIATVRDDEDFDGKTPVNASDAELIAFRLSRTSTDSRRAADNSAELRREMREDVGRVNERIDGVIEKVDGVSGDVREMKGQLTTLVGLVEKQLDAANEVKTLTVTTKLDVEKAQAMVPVDRARASIENWKVVVGSIFGTGGIVFIVLGMLGKLGKCG